MREMRREDSAALGQCLVSIEQGLGTITEHMRIRGTSCTLAVETWFIPPSGALSRDWAVPFASVAVANHSSTDPVTVISGTGQNVPPTSGPGMAYIRALGAAAWNLSGYSLTIYGKAGELVTLSVFTREQPPAWR